MATKEETKKIALKAIEDDAFRAELEKDPAKAASSIGITLSAEDVEAIKNQVESAKSAGSRESKSIFFI
ncbi:hypothetical protein I5677_03455 [Mobilitalea sibirica]|uniref:Uncharacterized protein n=1 Tax=Mobilitalea sibirica TaxID=1462919 RepID=A0A8J7KS49_9FIRM|nr:Os1348 family NHLP clan protein [Mobilitalea sibirica]MBH1939951.1 hypothetical protein [Mobilitalea sibirica]